MKSIAPPPPPPPQPTPARTRPCVWRPRSASRSISLRVCRRVPTCLYVYVSCACGRTLTQGSPPPDARISAVAARVRFLASQLGPGGAAHVLRYQLITTTCTIVFTRIITIATLCSALNPSQRVFASLSSPALGPRAVRPDPPRKPKGARKGGAKGAVTTHPRGLQVPIS